MKKIIPYLPYMVCALLIILVFVLFRSLRKEDNDTYKQVIKAYQLALDAKQEVIDSKKEQNQVLDNIIIGYEKRDSQYQRLIADLQPRYKANDNKLENIPSTIRNLSKDSLRFAAINY